MAFSSQKSYHFDDKSYHQTEKVCTSSTIPQPTKKWCVNHNITGLCNQKVSPPLAPNLSLLKMKLETTKHRRILGFTLTVVKQWRKWGWRVWCCWRLEGWRLWGWKFHPSAGRTCRETRSDRPRLGPWKISEGETSQKRWIAGWWTFWNILTLPGQPESYAKGPGIVNELLRTKQEHLVEWSMQSSLKTWFRKNAGTNVLYALNTMKEKAAAASAKRKQVA